MNKAQRMENWGTTSYLRHYIQVIRDVWGIRYP